METQLIANLIGYIAAGIGIVMFIPQVVQCWKTKDTKAISSFTFSLFALASLLWLIYGILLKAYPVILVNSVLLILNIFLLFLKRKYG